MAEGAKVESLNIVPDVEALWNQYLAQAKQQADHICERGIAEAGYMALRVENGEPAGHPENRVVLARLAELLPSLNIPLHCINSVADHATMEALHTLASTGDDSPVLVRPSVLSALLAANDGLNSFRELFSTMTERVATASRMADSHDDLPSDEWDDAEIGRTAFYKNAKDWPKQPA